MKIFQLYLLIPISHFLTGRLPVFIHPVRLLKSLRLFLHWRADPSMPNQQLKIQAYSMLVKIILLLTGILPNMEKLKGRWIWLKPYREVMTFIFTKPENLPGFQIWPNGPGLWERGKKSGVDISGGGKEKTPP